MRINTKKAEFIANLASSLSLNKAKTRSESAANIYKKSPVAPGKVYLWESPALTLAMKCKLKYSFKNHQFSFLKVRG